MSLLNSLLDNIDDVAARLGLPADQVQALVAGVKDRIAGGADPLAAFTAVAQDHGLSLDRLSGLMGGQGGGDLLAKATAALDRDGDGNPLNDLGNLAKGLLR